MGQENLNEITARQWDLVCFIEEFWGEHRAFPSLDIIKRNVEGFPGSTDEVAVELNSAQVKVRLKNRGVNYSAVLKKTDPDWRNPSRLSDKQLAVISTLLNPLDRRSQNRKLAELGIGPTQFYGWMKEDRFKNYYTERAEELFGEGLPMAHEALLRKVTEGNISAIKLFYEVSGRHTGVNKEEMTNLKLLFARLTEAIQRHVTPEVMRNIIADLNDAMSSSGVPDNIELAAIVPPVAESEYI